MVTTAMKVKMLVKLNEDREGAAYRYPLMKLIPPLDPLIPQRLSFLNIYRLELNPRLQRILLYGERALTISASSSPFPISRFVQIRSVTLLEPLRELEAMGTVRAT